MKYFFLFLAFAGNFLIAGTHENEAIVERRIRAVLSLKDLQIKHCYNNTSGTAIKSVCFAKMPGLSNKFFVLKLADGSRETYEAIKVKSEGVSETEHGDIKWIYQVKRVDYSLNRSAKTATFETNKKWEYGEGYTYFRGRTPEGRVFSALVDSFE